MRIITAPDSFKGSLSAKDLCLAMEEGILKADPNAEVVHLPMADGGEGTIESMVFATHGEIFTAEVQDPLGRTIQARYGCLGDGRTAVIEMAQASGLPLLKEEERNPLIASSFGTGQLIRNCLDRGYSRILIGLGGSATNDGGMGMMRALGMEFLDAEGRSLPEGGAGLLALSRIDASRLDSRIANTSFIAASDVTNPLCGENGASHIFGPQKGADREAVLRLDAALKHYAEIIKRQFAVDIIEQPGAGAAGGMGAGAMAFLGAEMRSGIEIVMEFCHFSEQIERADLVMTGEGKLDSQTLSGKVIAGICKLAKQNRVPAVALCGSMSLQAKDMDLLGLDAGFSIVNGPCSLEQAIADAYRLTADKAEQIIRLLGISKQP